MKLQEPLMSYLGETFDLTNLAYEYEVPVHFIFGDSDWITPFMMEESFLENLKAPKKSFVLIENSGHYPMFDNPEEFCRVILNILK
ncbi:alpha/beta hydrolase [Tissierella sp. MSJ-40]|uniref:Alpha/beta hydrolase n=1 Tax=Tissierella simiarum TaxID=2841534 RepID=A0ABS6E7M4_9FIRM|nr:alpha/beta hydrolase [Tissierella simiarum]MBU5438754.1 alpha/beta hydrolase [Tissierella simiarum]